MGVEADLSRLLGLGTAAPSPSVISTCRQVGVQELPLALPSKLKASILRAPHPSPHSPPLYLAFTNP